jgi:hypothetical protein
MNKDLLHFYYSLREISSGNPRLGSSISRQNTDLLKTEKAFGDYIDKYSIRQAVDDGVTVEIIYEGRTHTADVPDREAMNKRFEECIRGGQRGKSATDPAPPAG